MTKDGLPKTIKPMRLDTRQVIATLNGTMTEIRVPIKPQPSKGMSEYPYHRPDGMFIWTICGGVGVLNLFKPPYQQSDILYARETWGKDKHDKYHYRVDYPEHDYKPYPIWHRPTHMPKEAARIFLQVTDIKIEMVQDITEEGAIAGGFINTHGFIRSPDNEYEKPAHTAKENFVFTWNNLYKNWADNPWVWVLKFKRLEVE